jgi:hypothetical protein
MNLNADFTKRAVVHAATTISAIRRDATNSLAMEG